MRRSAAGRTGTINDVFFDLKDPDKQKYLTAYGADVILNNGVKQKYLSVGGEDEDRGSYKAESAV